jgi:predicted DNA-binding transcriptional regulator AlpA
LDIVGITEIAQLLGLKHATVTNWHRRGHMPAPDAQLSFGPVWRRSTIERWLQKEGDKRVRNVGLWQKLGAAS